MSTSLRPYQAEAKTKIYKSWAAHNDNVLLVLPTGSGKTRTFCDIIRANEGGSIAVAHRQELVLQMSLTLAEYGIRHTIIASTKTVQMIITEHQLMFGECFYDPSSKVAVASIDTLIRRGDSIKNLIQSVTLWVMDEAHHVLRANKWGTGVELFTKVNQLRAMLPNARGLGVTATPCRADGRGLGAHASGVFHDMIVGPSMRDLINMGYLSEYRVIAARSNFDRSNIKVSKATGDFSLNSMRAEVGKSSLVVSDDKAQIVGDIVQSYLKFAKGKLGITFLPDLETAARVAEQFNEAGVPARVITGKTKSGERALIMRMFRARKILQIVNVDILGEGADVPACEVVSEGRPTESYGLYVQHFGRAIRLFEGKTHGIYIDHVGNVKRHGLPDAEREWTLDDRERKSKEDKDIVATRACMNEECLSTYERYLKVCPYCGAPVPPPSERNGPEWVDGDLFELDAETLAQMRAAISEINRPIDHTVAEYRADLVSKNVPQIGVIAHVKRHIVKRTDHQNAASAIKDMMAVWAGYKRADGRTDAEIFRIFYITFGVDWLTAQSLKADKMNKLCERIFDKVGK